MFWDPNFTQFSPSQTDAVDFAYSNTTFDTQWYPRMMVPRLLGMIANDYKGHTQAAPGLSFSEYNAGCETQIEGGVAEADLLGIFGREGMFSATAWPLQGITTNNKLSNYLVAAYDLYRNYDGKGSTVGDTAVMATTPDVTNTSVYAFTHSTDATKMELVVVNKANTPTAATITLANAPALSTASAYSLVKGGSVGVSTSANPAAVSCSGGSCTVTFTMPATSASTLVLR
jgi:hypothetical protein